MFLLLFTLALLIANIYCFFKKKYLYLFIPCMLFLPEYYGIDFSNSLPVLSVTRMMYIVFFLYAFLNHRRTFSMKTLSSQNIRSYIFLGVYFFFRVMSNLYFFPTSFHAGKTILSIIIEQLFLLIALYCLAPSTDEIDTIIKCIVWTAAALFIIGFFESITGIRPFDSLYTVTRIMMNEYYVRLGLLRAVTTMGMPGFFSNVCLMILPLTFYLYNKFSDNKYLAIIVLDIITGIHSGTRAFFFFMPIIVIIYIIFIFISKKYRLRCIKNFVIILTLLGIIIGIASLSSPYLKYYYSGYAKSLLNEVGFNYDLDSDAPPGVEGYGKNIKKEGETGGTFSRLVQLSGIEYALSINPLFGLGSDAIAKNRVKYFRKGQWRVSKAIDLGLVEIIMLEGILGLIGYVCLFIFLFSFNGKNKNTLNSHLFFLLVLSYLFSTLSTANMPGFLIMIIALSMKFRVSKTPPY